MVFHLLAFASCLFAFPDADTKKVTAVVQTTPVANAGDAADDPAIWVHPTDPGQSLILGTNKQAGLVVYALDGHQVQSLADVKLNHVDVRQAVVRNDSAAKPSKPATIDLAAAGGRDDASIHLYRIDPKSRKLSTLASAKTGLAECHGFCLYRPNLGPNAGKLFAFANDRSGAIEQWLLEPHADALAATLVRRWAVATQPAGMAADDDARTLYLAEARRGLWRFPADPQGDHPDPQLPATLVDETTPKGRLTQDIGGIAIYRGKDDTGYIIISDQRASQFLIYRREGKNQFVGAFSITATPTIDAVQEPVGIEVTASSLGALFPFGAFVTQDRVVPGKNQNFKIVAWDTLANAFQPPLQITPSR